MQWGKAAAAAGSAGAGQRFRGDAAQPGFLHDVFMRVGGPDGDATSPVGVSIVMDTVVVVVFVNYCYFG